MSSSFDPYHKWLGIRPQEQPANHYRLLGIGDFETDPDVIDSAADQRTLHVRSFQTGPHSAESQKLLNEIAAARRCLLDPAQRAAYDEKLRASQPSPEATQPAIVAQPLPVAESLPVVELPAVFPASRHRGARTKSGKPAFLMFVIGGAAMGLLGLAVIIALASRGGNHQSVSVTGPPLKKSPGSSLADKSAKKQPGRHQKVHAGDLQPPANPKNNKPIVDVVESTPAEPQPSDSTSSLPILNEAPAAQPQGGRSVVRIDFNNPAVLADFVLAEAPGRKWLVDRGLLQIEGGFAHTTYGKYFKSFTSVTIRGGIQLPEGRNFRVSVGSLNMILNWEGADQNHYRLGETTTASVATEPRALTPGRIEEITVRQEGTEVIVEINGQRQYSGVGQLEGTVTVYPAGSPIVVQEIVIDGEVDPTRKVTGPSHKNLY